MAINETQIPASTVEDTAEQIVQDAQAPIPATVAPPTPAKQAPGVVEIYDISGKEAVKGSMAPDEVTDAVASGKFSFPKGKPIRVVSPDGEIGTLSPEEAPSAFQQGYKFATPEDEKQAKYGDTAGMAKTFLSGAAEGVAGPLGTLAQVALGRNPEDIRGEQEVNPGTYAAGEATGFAGSMLSGVGIAPAITKAGQAAVKGIGLATRASTAAKIGSTAAQMAAETALIQSGHEVSKMIVQDPNQSVDTAITDIGLAALMGGGIGGAFGTVSPLWEAASGTKTAQLLKKFANKAGGVEGAVPDAVEEAVERAGLSLSPEVRSAMDSDPYIKEMASKLIQTDTNSSGMAMQGAMKKFREDASNAVAGAFGKTSDDIANMVKASDYEVGQKVQKTLSNKLKETIDPISKQFDEVSKQFKGVEIPEPHYSEIAEAVSKVAQEKGYTLSVSAPGTKIISDVLTELPGIKTLEQLRQYQSIIGEKTTEKQLFALGKDLKTIFRNAEEAILDESIAAKMATRDMVSKDAGPTTYYHGMKTPMEGDSLRPGRGNAIFVTTNPKRASSYASDTWNDAKMAYDASGANVVPVHVNVRNTFDATNPEHLARLPKNIRQSINPTAYETLENTAVTDAMKKAGFDSYLVREAGDTNLAIFSPENIRPKFSKAHADPFAEVAAREGMVAEGENLLAMHKQARGAYRDAMKVVDDLNDRLHVGRYSGPGSFLKALNEMAPEDVLRRLSPKGDVTLLNELQTTFPEVAGELRDYHLGKLLEAGAGKAGSGEAINVGALTKAIDKLSPEMQQWLVGPEAKGKINAVQQLLKAAETPNFNHPNTARTVDKLLGGKISGAISMIGALASENTLTGLLLGPLVKVVGKDAPDAIRLAALKFMGSNAPIEAGAFKSAVDFINATIKGQNMIKSATGKVFKAGAEVLPTHAIPKERDLEKLDKTVQSSMSNPDKLLEVGGKTSHYMPQQGTAMAMTAGTAAQYLESIRPKKVKTSPLDTDLPIPAAEKAKYNRQLSIAQQPLMVLKHLSDGTIQSQDMITLKAIYPSLYTKLSADLTAHIISKQAKGDAIPYKTRIGLSTFLGQPLDSTLTPESIMAAQPKPAQGIQEPEQGKPPSAASMKGLQKMPSQFATSLQANQARNQKP